MPGLSYERGSSQTDPRQTNRRNHARPRSKATTFIIPTLDRVTIPNKLDRAIAFLSKPIKHSTLPKRPTNLIKPNQRAVTVPAIRIE